MVMMKPDFRDLSELQKIYAIKNPMLEVSDLLENSGRLFTEEPEFPY
jgi:hypothetical protein